MNWVDVVVIGIVLVYALIGWRRGFLDVGAELLSLALGLAAAFVSFRPLGAWIAEQRGLRVGLTQGAAFIIVWAVVQGLVSLAFRRSIRRLPKETRKGKTNRVFGVLPSALKGIVGAALFVTVLSIWRSGTAAADVERSRLGAPMVAVVTRTEQAAYNTFQDAFRDLQEAMGRNPEVEGFRKLDFHTTDVQVDRGAEDRMLQYVNEERRNNGLEPLVADETLREAARGHSRDMLARGYFAHETPQGVSPFDRMHKAGITYREAGENLAFALTVEVAHDGLMRSPGHRKNILTPEFRKVGIGAVRAGPRGTMFTQDFTN